MPASRDGISDVVVGSAYDHDAYGRVFVRADGDAVRFECRDAAVHTGDGWTYPVRSESRDAFIRATEPARITINAPATRLESLTPSPAPHPDS